MLEDRTRCGNTFLPITRDVFGGFLEFGENPAPEITSASGRFAGLMPKRTLSAREMSKLRTPAKAVLRLCTRPSISQALMRIRSILPSDSVNPANARPHTVMKLPASLRLLRFGSLAALLAAQPAHAANQMWDGGSTVDGNWSTITNWDGDSAAPGATSGTTNADIATFNAAIANTWGLAGTPIVIPSNQNIGGISFDATAGNYFIGTTTGNSIKLSSGGTIQILNTLAATNAIETVNAPLVIQGAERDIRHCEQQLQWHGRGRGHLEHRWCDQRRRRRSHRTVPRRQQHQFQPNQRHHRQWLRHLPGPNQRRRGHLDADQGPRLHGRHHHQRRLVGHCWTDRQCDNALFEHHQ